MPLLRTRDLGTDYVSFVCVLSYVVCGGGPDILLITLWERPLLWSRGNVVGSHAAGPVSILGRVSFLVEIFPGFSSTIR